MTDKEQYQICLDTRKSEIQLFWQRSLFFWGFISAALIAFSSLYDKHKGYAIIVAGFGFICSLVWTLANRGSKRLQDNWGLKAEVFEPKLGIDLFTKAAPLNKNGFWVLRARTFSVSKLAIALSDFALFIWFLIFIFSALSYSINISIELFLPWGIFAFVAFVVLYGILIIIFARTNKKYITAETNEKQKKESH